MDGDDRNRTTLASTGAVEFHRQEDSVADLSGKVHQLPCCIKYDGVTSVSHYFKPQPTGVEIDGLKVEKAYFRGRNLHGTNLPLPQGYFGCVLGRKGPKRSVMPEENPNCWEVNAKFDNITIWNHDSLPSQDDAFMRAFHWFPVAKALHRPVTVEDLESMPKYQELE